MKKTLNEKVFPEFLFSRNVENNIKCKKNITPTPNYPTFEIQKSEQGNRGYIGYIIPLFLFNLLFGETTSHLTSK